MQCNKCNRTIPEDSKYCPFCGEFLAKAMPQETNTQTIHSSDVLWGIVSIIFIVSLVLVLALGQANEENELISYEYSLLEKENESLKKELTAVEKVAKEYSDMESKITSSEVGFSSSKYLFVLKPNETETFTLRTEFNEANTISTRHNGYSATATFAENKWVNKVDVTITAVQKGFTEIVYGNSVDGKTFSIYIIVV